MGVDCHKLLSVGQVAPEPFKFCVPNTKFIQLF
jgi:hypothetical protein